VDSITAKHLALSANCVRLILNEIMPNLKENMLTAPSLGSNIKKLMYNESNELEKELKSHIREVFTKLVSIMVEAVTMSIQKAA